MLLALKGGVTVTKYQNRFLGTSYNCLEKLFVSFNPLQNKIRHLQKSDNSWDSLVFYVDVYFIKITKKPSVGAHVTGIHKPRTVCVCVSEHTDLA